MKRAKRLEPVLRIAELEVDRAGGQLAMAQQRVVQEETKLAQLKEYQQDYRRQLQESGKTGMTVDRLRLFDGFHQQLDRAIAHQQEMIVLLQGEQARAHERWRQLDIRHKSLQKMLERFKKEAATIQARNEQRNHDEYARRRNGDTNWS